MIQAKGTAMSASAIVVGSGVMGASIAFSLAKCGYAVTVVDKKSGPAQGSTGATSAIVRFTYSLRDSIALAWESKHLWDNLRDYVQAPESEPVADFIRTGMAVIDVPGLLPTTVRTDFEDLSIPYTDWDAADLARELPGIDTSNHYPPVRPDDPGFLDDSNEPATALYTPDGGYISDPVLATENFARAAERHDAQFLYNAEVIGLQHRTINPHHSVAGSPGDDGSTGEGATAWSLELADGRVLDAEVVVNAAGPWSSRLNELAKVGSDHGISVTPLRQEVHTLPAESTVIRSDGSPIPALLDAGIGTYMRAEVGGQLLIGGSEPECDELDWIKDPDTVSMSVRPKQFETQALRAAKRFNDITIPNRARGVVGVYDASTDWTPIYDRCEADGFYQAIGTSGNQFKNAPMVGELMAELIDAVEHGHDHDGDPVRVALEHTGGELNLGTFSRLRSPAQTSGNVMG
ncbi:NAD(P)/FAD-dependent oxidoreductase [Brevibacterium antiquum]|uniref:Glycine/D-amino acid oxidase (Deaminating) n=1 Tax=Brevibacterium antiquum TaxID=234835 RepID=A0A2H1J873_9MICO|nr:FAD-dependent oxidoreductase [Brevibacterium antiquum]SMX83528.1 Glycine/D-amino acid oxidase (deaminating) [Brevibacterium antiquum]